MKNFKRLIYIVLAFVVAGFVSCTKDATNDAPSYGQGLYFPIGDSDILVDSNSEGYIAIPVYRTSADADYAGYLYASDYDNRAFSISGGIVDFSFWKGETETIAYIPISTSTILNNPDKPYILTLTFADGDQITPYGIDMKTFRVLYSPWENIGECQWRDSSFDYAWGITVNPIVYTPIDQSQLYKGRYRIHSPYSQFYLSIFGTGIVQESYIYLNMTMGDDHVYIETSETGFQLLETYGFMQIGSLCGENGWMGDAYGKNVNGTITFPANGMVLYLPNYVDEKTGDVGLPLYANSTGRMRIVLPGGVTIDPVVTPEYQGLLTDEENLVYAYFRMSLNGDTGSYRWAIVEGALDDAEIETYANNIKAGTVSYDTSSASELRYELDTPNSDYTAIFVPYSQDGSVAGTYSSYRFTYTAGGDAVGPRDFDVDIKISSPTQTTFLMTLTPNSLTLPYVWERLTRAAYDKAVAEYGSIDKYKAAQIQEAALVHGLSVRDEISRNHRVRGSVDRTYITQLEPDTEYVFYAYCIDLSTGLSKSPICISEQNTLPIGELEPDYEGWLGTWEVVPTCSWEDVNGSATALSPKPFEITIELCASNASYYIFGWGDVSVAARGTGYPLEATWSTNPTTGEAMLRISEQELFGPFDSAYGPATLSFWGIVMNGTVPSYFGWGGVMLIGRLSDTEGEASITGATITDASGARYSVIGGEYVLNLNDTNFLTYRNDIHGGPFTLKRKSTAANFAPSALELPADDAALVRQALHKAFNRVEVR